MDRFQWFYYVICQRNINIILQQIRNIISKVLTWLCKVKAQKIAGNGQTYVVYFQIESYRDSFNLLRTFVSFKVHVACRVNKNLEIQKNL